VPDERSELPAGRPVIEPYLSRLRSHRLIAELDAIFFASSATQTFADDAARAAFRERWLGRFLAHDPQHAFLAIAAGRGAGETLAGYLVGALDDPAKAARFADLSYFREMAHLTARYPAQLHVNLAPGWRGQGIGRDLVSAFCDHAAAAGAPGVHVFTAPGMRNVRFYAACGFAEVGRCDWNGHEIVMLARRL